MADFTIDAVPLSNQVNYFYWGRHPDHDIMDMRLGGGAYAVHNGDEAVILDTMMLPGHGNWVRNYMVHNHGIRHFTVVNTHWHPDHIAENHVYKDCPIIAHTETREFMLKYKQQLETPGPRGHDGFPVVPPNITFEGRFDIWLGTLKLEFHEFLIHERGHVALLIPEQKVFLAADMLEDPIWIFRFNFASPETQLAEYERMLGMDFERIFACHSTLETVKSGGYDKRFITNSMNYLRRMMSDSESPHFGEKPPQDYIADALENGELTWWEPYAFVHKRNIASIKAFRAGSPTAAFPAPVAAKLGPSASQ